jgi:outer membrane protein assembly factor BamB
MEQPLIIGSNGFVSAIDRGTGAELWRTRLQEGLIKATHSADVSVLVRDGIIYAGSTGHLFALDMAGKILWHNGLDGMGFNDVALAMEGVSVQFLQKTVQSNSSSSST